MCSRLALVDLGMRMGIIFITHSTQRNCGNALIHRTLNSLYTHSRFIFTNFVVVVDAAKHSHWKINGAACRSLLIDIKVNVWRYL